VGDIFAWFVESATLPDIHAEAARRNVLLHTVLSDKAAALRPGQSGLLALGRWNGCRTPLVDADLGGIVLGYSLTTPPEAVYRALIEATAFGTRLIVELFTSAGVNVTSMRAGGGLTKNEMLLGIYADVLGLPLEVSGTEQASALGAAILGAVAGAAYASVGEAAQAMAPPPSRTVSPHSEYHAVYDTLYLEYCALVDVFGRDANSTLKHLRALQRENS
jgi:L-ribulokinase